MAHPCQTHRQTIISHYKHFLDAWMSTLNLPHNAVEIAAGRTISRRQTGELRREFAGGTGAGDRCQSTGSSHTLPVPRVQK